MQKEIRLKVCDSENHIISPRTHTIRFKSSKPFLYAWNMVKFYVFQAMSFQDTSTCQFTLFLVNLQRNSTDIYKNYINMYLSLLLLQLFCIQIANKLFVLQIRYISFNSVKKKVNKQQLIKKRKYNQYFQKSL